MCGEMQSILQYHITCLCFLVLTLSDFEVNKSMYWYNCLWFSPCRDGLLRRTANVLQFQWWCQILASWLALCRTSIPAGDLTSALSASAQVGLLPTTQNVKRFTKAKARPGQSASAGLTMGLTRLRCGTLSAPSHAAGPLLEFYSWTQPLSGLSILPETFSKPYDINLLFYD